MVDILYMQDMDNFKCSDPECKTPHDPVMNLHPGCHPQAALDVAYEAGLLTVSCNECDAEVATIAVARRGN